MPEELSEISTLLSMVDIAPTNKLRSAGTQVSESGTFT